MNPECLQYRLTPDQRDAFNKDGFLIVENALDESMTARLIEVVDRVEARQRNDENRGRLLSVTNVIQEDNALVELVSWPTTLPKVWGILGWNIYLYQTHLAIF